MKSAFFKKTKTFKKKLISLKAIRMKRKISQHKLDLYVFVVISSNECTLATLS